MKEIILCNRHFSDINPIQIGKETCENGHSFGPAIRRYTLLHYVRRGKGTLYKNGNVYPVNAGEMFIILPGELTVYTADQNDPWDYRWIGFDGALSEKFAALPPVVPIADGLFPNMDDIIEEGGILEYALAAKMFYMISELFAGKKQHNHYVRQVCDYIKTSYMQEIRVERIAENLNLDRRYLSRLFKKKIGQTVQEYLISVRMEEAKRLLAQGHTVAETSVLCGYPDMCNFSKMFKKTYGISPAYWKGQNE